MKKPAISFENAEILNEYYKHNLPNNTLRKFGYGVLCKLYYPRIHYINDAKNKIINHDDSGGRFIITANHTSKHDQFTVAVTTAKVPGLKNIRGQATVLSKPSNFSFPKRALFEAMGATPIWRQEDIMEISPRPTDRQIGKAALLAMDVPIYRMNEQNFHGAIFPEGTRNYENKRLVQEFHVAGLRRMVDRLNDGANGAVVPMGIWYTGTGLRPHVAISEPIVIGNRKGADILNELHPIMQECVDVAYSKSFDRMIK